MSRLGAGLTCLQVYMKHNKRNIDVHMLQKIIIFI
uniref:Uncharacterized protein n=1 Tax=Heterorhabditis bacteriophora TaxID=37862 RepID=A0A1I7WLK4_HETBA